MTEMERLIKKGLITEDFLQEEVRCDYLVSTTLKKIWAIELDLLFEFDRVCKKHNLRYFLIWGSLLGAVRHQDFIPWDDDIDVAMPRDDFDKLNQLGGEFAEPLFLQTPYTDPGYAISHTLLRNSNTTAITPITKYQKMNQGLFMDILPLDNIKSDTFDETVAQIRRLNIENGTFMRLTNPELDDANKARVANYHRNPQADYEEIHRIATRYNGEETDSYGILVFTNGNVYHDKWAKSNFATTREVRFGNFTVPIPSGYDHILEINFPNYMKLPPVETRGKDHSHYLLDPDHPYTYYTDKLTR